MSNAAKLTEILRKSGRVFYHFTDTKNLPSIRQYGLLSMHKLRQERIIVSPGGNQWSLDADRRLGMDRYVHLCFFRGHPMEWVAKKDGRIENSRFLRIDPAVLMGKGVLVTQEVSNKSGVLARPADEVIAQLDLEVIYTRTDWKDPKIQARLKKAQKYELLVPDQIGLDLIRNLD